MNIPKTVMEGLEAVEEEEGVGNEVQCQAGGDISLLEMLLLLEDVWVSLVCLFTLKRRT